MKKIIAVVLSLLMFSVLFSGCKKDSGMLEVNFTLAGYGEEYVNELEKAFEAETNIPVHITTDNNVTGIFSGKIGDVRNNTIDVFFNMMDCFPLIDSNKNKSGYDNLFLDLSELYQREVPGRGGKKLIDIVRPDLYEAGLTYEMDGSKGKAYTIPWSTSMEGLLYNKKVLDKFGITQIPRTTNEFEDVLIRLKTGVDATGAYSPLEGALSCANNAGYWEFIWVVWWAQYEGLDTFYTYFSGETENSAPGDAPSWENLKQPGKQYAMEELYRFINKDKGYMSPDSVNTDNVQVQVRFLDGDIAFIPSGDWVEAESAGDYEGVDLDYRFMKTPVTSKLGEKLGISEQELIAAIDYVDGTTEVKPSFAVASGDTQKTDEIIARVAEARGLVSSLLSAHNKIAIPAYSDRIEEAYQFVLFFASDKGQEIMTKYAGAPSAFDYRPSEEDMEEFSPFRRSIFEILNDENSQMVLSDTKYPIVYKAGLKRTAHYAMTNGNRGFEAVMYNGTTPVEQLYNADWQYYRDKWPTMLMQAGYGIA